MHPTKLYGNEAEGRKVFETIMTGNSWHGEIEMVAKDGDGFLLDPRRAIKTTREKSSA